MVFLNDFTSSQGSETDPASPRLIPLPEAFIPVPHFVKAPSREKSDTQWQEKDGRQLPTFSQTSGAPHAEMPKNNLLQLNAAIAEFYLATLAQRTYEASTIEDEKHDKYLSQLNNQISMDELTRRVKLNSVISPSSRLFGSQGEAQMPEVKRGCPQGHGLSKALLTRNLGNHRGRRPVTALHEYLPRCNHPPGSNWPRDYGVEVPFPPDSQGFSRQLSASPYFGHQVSATADDLNFDRSFSRHVTAPADLQAHRHGEENRLSDLAKQAFAKPRVEREECQDHADVSGQNPLIQRAREVASAGGGMSGYTTVMIQQVPFKYTQAKFIQEVNAHGFEGTYDFLYLPVNARNHSNRGFGFINFVSPSYAEMFYAKLHRQKLMYHQETSLPLSVIPADVQGFEQSAARFFESWQLRKKKRHSEPVFMKPLPFHTRERGYMDTDSV